MSEADPQGGVESAGSLNSPTADGATACPRSPSVSTTAATMSNAAHATAPWPGVSLPRHRATYMPVGGAGAAMMCPTPPRYISRAPVAPMTPEAAASPSTIQEAGATKAEAPDTQEALIAPTTTNEDDATKTDHGARDQGKLRLLSLSANMVGEGLAKIYGKALIAGASAMDLCKWAGVPVIPWFFKAHLSNVTNYSELPGFFMGLSCAFENANEVFEGMLQGANKVFEGSSLAFGALGGSSRIVHAVCSYMPSYACSQFKSGKVHVPYGPSSSCPPQGLHTILSYHIIKRSFVDSVLIVEDNSGSRRSPKRVLPRVQAIKTLDELKISVAKFKNGDPVHLIDISEEDVPPELALDFWKVLLSEGATALLKRDSNLCRMSKLAYSLIEEKLRLETQLDTLNHEAEEIKNCINVLSDMLVNTKPKSAKLAGHVRSIDFNGVGESLPSTSITTVATSEDNAQNLPSSESSD